MSRACSVSARRVYGGARVCRLWGVARSTHYARRARAGRLRPVPGAASLAGGLVLQHDHGPQYMSRAFQQEVAFLGIESSPSFVRSPQGNGMAERFIRILKEQLLWVRSFDTVEELRQALLEFKERFNWHWLLKRHGYKTSAEVRVQYEPARESPVGVKFSVSKSVSRGYRALKRASISS